ncbi:AAA family ATPase [Iningainema tapete]|uniref:AAA family ATPase n=1 Tax=Iningainema tapete BLCC-T55 TaxID=2748662 RepID=A0A8J6XN71_9CYAN|nr:AAA family ATPase [Iningainema tapete]MBD2776307.1 AAA family ATPase [Iningainema tapete BLCC-T55]
MRIKRLVINSFRGIDDMTLEFDETSPTVLIGINGVGKSSILDCLAILLSQFTGRIQISSDSIRSLGKDDITYGSRETNNEIQVLIDSKELTWSLTQARDEDPLSAFKALSNNLEKLNAKIKKDSRPGGNKINPLMEAFAEQIQFTLSTIAGGDLPEDVGVIVEELRSQVEALPVAVYYPVNRAVLDIPLEITDKSEFVPTDAYQQALTGGRIDFKTFFDWFRNREDLENELRVNNLNYQDPQLQATRQAIKSLLPGFENLRVRRSPLRMTIEKQSQELVVNQLSDGEKCLLAMVGDLARRLAIANPVSANPLQGTGVVLIDEIELHLHPRWQRQIIPALTTTFPNCQFIFTTHSPQVLSHIKPEGIYLLTRTDEGIIAQQPESSFGRDSNQILEDIMDVPERPTEIQENLAQMFRLIDEGNLSGARQLRQNLANEIGEDDPEFVRADVLIRRKEILNR